ncbi:thioredoxin domain-containing protein [Thalassobacillus sp. CUG 92003]|uniref:thioredoxin domain-containing protein n=1 Tax=Thalassobacillus sp. CUG 92003 TaxID=2736641 RepID=UPI0015E74499|nr:thioredoxin domain-containing protein [Thalassobacillus sp. CUG 92003]
MAFNQKSNKLITEQSPYLQQHAYNPVQWFPWGEEAFEKAEREDKPIFLSIGYSTCHWCHVMAHESFEDEETAAKLNERFVPIKVDREERPDIDSIYMTVCQMLTQHGGWPLNVFLTPDQKPFYAGTYFPKDRRYGLPSFTDVITQLYDQYKQDPEKITKASNQITEALNKQGEIDKESQLSEENLHQTFAQLANNFDESFGGFGEAPKFPSPHMMMFLFRYNHWMNSKQALHYATHTLASIADGGINDHVGNGFARYSVDEKWLVPHFEKMLYDNALLLFAYTEGYQLTGISRFQEVSEQIVSFIQREMTAEDGGFYSAIDADSEGEEGKYYVWGYDEVMAALGPERGKRFTDVYHVTPEGNFEGKNIPHLIGTDLEAWASHYKMRVPELEADLKQSKEDLLNLREQRVYPHVDDKRLNAWNTLMIASLAKAGRTMNERAYTQLAERALAFVEDRLIKDGRLMVRFREGDVKTKGFLDDYAFLTWAYVELYETTYALSYLAKAKRTMNDMIELFWDEEQGGFYFTGHDTVNLIAREKIIFDGAMPSGNSVAAVMLHKLASLTGDLALRDRANEMASTFKREVERYPAGFTMFLQSLIYEEAPKMEVVIIGRQHDAQRQRLLQALQSEFLPHVAILVAKDPQEFAGIAEFATAYTQLNNETTVYMCENFACQQPTTDIEAVIKKLTIQHE